MMDPKEIRKTIEMRVSSHDRSVFRPLLADALENAPTAKAWKKLAKTSVPRYVQSVQGLARLNGYADKTEHVVEKRDIKETVTLIVAQRGIEGARKMLQGAGLPLKTEHWNLKDVTEGEFEEVSAQGNDEIMPHTDTEAL